MNLFDPRLGAAPASLIVTSVDSLPCEKLYPSNTPILKVFAFVVLPIKFPVAFLEPFEVTPRPEPAVPTVFTVTTQPAPPASAPSVSIEAFVVASSSTTKPLPLPLPGIARPVTPPLLTDVTIP